MPKEAEEPKNQYKLLTACQHCGAAEFEPVTGLCSVCLALFRAEVSSGERRETQAS